MSCAIAVLLSLLPAEPSVRVAVVVEERLDGERREESDVEAALIEGLAERPDVVFVDPARAAAVRAAAEGQRLSTVDIATLVDSLDSDLLIIGEVELVSADGGGLIKGIATVEASARLRVVAVDTAQVVGALREQAVASHYSPRFAAARSARALAEALAPKVDTLLARSTRYELQLAIPQPFDASLAEPIVQCIEAAPAISGVRVLHLGASVLKLELASAASPRELSLRFGRGKPSCGLRIQGYSARQLKGVYRSDAMGQVPVRAVPFAQGGPRRSRDRWLRSELPRLILTELSQQMFLDVDPSAPLRRSRARRGLRLEGGFSRQGPSLRVSARLVSAPSGKVVHALQEVCDRKDETLCLLGLARKLADGAFAAIGKRRESIDFKRSLQPAVEPLEVLAVTIEPLFPAQLSRYEQQRSVGQVEVRNAGSAVIEGLTLEAKLDGLSARASKSSPITLRPGARQTIPVTVWLDRSALVDHRANRTVPMDIDIAFRSEGFRYSLDRTAPVFVLDKHAVQWGEEPQGVAAFVDPSTRFVETMVRAARPVDVSKVPGPNRGTESSEVPLEHPLRDAVALFALLRDLRYAQDRVNPFAPDELDYVRYPSETWAEGAGDCDDLAVLYAALLEGAGQPALLIQTPGHVLVAAGTGLSPSAAERLTLDPDATLEHEHQLWVPIETTQVARGFLAAWRAGTDRMRALRRSGQAPVIIEIRPAWREHPPSDLADANDISPPAKADNKVVLAELRAMEKARRQALDQTLARLRQQRDAAGLNEVGVLLAFAGRMRQAQRSLLASLDLEPSAAAENNLGNVAVLDGRLPDAQKRYAQALTLAPKRLDILLNAVVASYLHSLEAPRAQEAMTVYIDRALALDPSAVTAFLDRLPSTARPPAANTPLALVGLRARIEARAGRDSAGLTAANAERSLEIGDLLNWVR